MLITKIEFCSTLPNELGTITFARINSQGLMQINCDAMSKLQPNERAFVIAHEFGHLSCPTTMPSELQEKLADLFADNYCRKNNIQINSSQMRSKVF